MNKIFAFWESKEQIPAYLELCKQTWLKYIPNLEITILNHSNLQDYIGDVYDIEDLKKISFPMQSDIVSAAILEKFGGLFIDLDCIVTDNIFNIFETISTDKLIGFGYPNKGMHLAVLYCKNKNNPILREWRKEAQVRLKKLPEKYDWSYFGNSILNPLLQSDKYKNDYLIIDRTRSGNILESKLMIGSTYATSKEDYLNCYFNSFFKFKVESVFELIKYGVVSLHNSWTPLEYKKIKSINEFMEKNIPLVELLKFILNKKHEEEYINIEQIESFLYSNLCSLKSYKKKGYFGEKFIIDFQGDEIQLGFDIYKGLNGFNLDIVIRNQDYQSIVNQLSIYSFEKNKSNVLKNATMDMILDTILFINKEYI
jgi:hypothetical protein